MVFGVDAFFATKIKAVLKDIQLPVFVAQSGTCSFLKIEFQQNQYLPNLGPKTFKDIFGQ